MRSAPDIAARAAANLARYPSGRSPALVPASHPLPPADAIYVNAAASHPVRAWLDALRPGGRLVFPLHATASIGAMVFVTRPERGEAWQARLFAGVIFISVRRRAGCCDGSQTRRGVPAWRRR